MISVQMNDRQLRKFLQGITVLPRVRQKKLLQGVGLMVQSQTRKSINAGGFQGPSKWIKAKKGVNKALIGVSRHVYWQPKTDRMGIVETRGVKYSLWQHVRGYTIPAGSRGAEDGVVGDWVVLPLKNPSALSPPVTNPFTFNWTRNKRPSVVPGRDILPSEHIIVTRGEMIAKRWSEKLIKEALQRAGKFAS